MFYMIFIKSFQLFLNHPIWFILLSIPSLKSHNNFLELILQALHERIDFDDTVLGNLSDLST